MILSQLLQLIDLLYIRGKQIQVFRLNQSESGIVNKNLKLSPDLPAVSSSPAHKVFMTAGPCVMNVGAVSEALLEGTADYCMIVCE